MQITNFFHYAGITSSSNNIVTEATLSVCHLLFLHFVSLSFEIQGTRSDRDFNDKERYVAKAYKVKFVLRLIALKYIILYKNI